MKKNFHNSIVCALNILLAAGCGRDAAKPQAGGDGGGLSARASVVATSFAPFDFARAIAGGRAEVSMLLPPGAESHSFEPTPRDVIKVKNCDLFIHVGGKSDAWVEALLKAADVDRKKVVTLMDCVSVVEEKIVEGMQHDGHADHAHESHEDHAHGDAEPEYDEHVWTSPKNALLIVQKISAALSEADPANASAYLMNTLNCIGNLVLLDTQFESLAAAAARKTIVFGDRFPFRYLADAYGLEYFAAFPGCATETEPSAATMKFLIDKVGAEKIPVVFHIELSNRKIADAISEATGAKVLQLHSCHNVSKSDFKRGATYLGLMAQNLENLREALR